MGVCNQNTTKGAKYYFNNVQEEINSNNHIGPHNTQNASLDQRVALICTLKNVDTNDEYKVELLIYQDTQRQASKSGGFTEKRMKDPSNNISFEQFFAMPYYFEKQQLLDFKVYSNATSNNFETVQTSLGSIMGSRGQTFKKKLSNGSDIFITGREIKKSSKLVNFDITVKGNMVGMGIRYTITNLGTETKPCNTKLYDSEIKNISKNNNKNNMTFLLCKIPVMF